MKKIDKRDHGYESIRGLRWLAGSGSKFTSMSPPGAARMEEICKEKDVKPYMKKLLMTWMKLSRESNPLHQIV